MAGRVVILEPDLDGHHAFWLSLLVEAHRRAGWAVEVLTAVDAARLHAQAALRGYLLGPAEGVRLHAVREGGGDAALLAQARELARASGAERIFVAFLDRFWSAILAEDAAVAEGAGAARIEGIWFHPHALDARWRWAPPLGKRWATRGRLHRFLASPRAAARLAGIVFPVAEPEAALARVNPRLGARVVPDPFEREPALGREAARARLGLPAERFIFLHLGSPERRKGLPDLLAAFASLPAGVRGRALLVRAEPAEWRGRKPLLLRVGSNARLKGAERRRLEALRAEGWVRTVEDFVPAEELMEYFAAADRVVIPYRKFRYSSGILANAIGAGRAVIAADHGEIGRAVAELGVGELYPHGSVTGLAAALGRALAEGGAAPRAEAAAVRARAGRTAEAFIEAVVGTL
jgi:glycosyltransferase involved in cell wall biosynthesis